MGRKRNEGLSHPHGLCGGARGNFSLEGNNLTLSDHLPSPPPSVLDGLFSTRPRGLVLPIPHPTPRGSRNGLIPMRGIPIGIVPYPIPVSHTLDNTSPPHIPFTQPIGVPLSFTPSVIVADAFHIVIANCQCFLMHYRPKYHKCKRECKWPPSCESWECKCPQSCNSCLRSSKGQQWKP